MACIGTMLTGPRMISVMLGDTVNIQRMIINPLYFRRINTTPERIRPVVNRKTEQTILSGRFIVPQKSRSMGEYK